MDDTGHGHDAQSTTVPCRSCGTDLPPTSKFCNQCGAPLVPATQSAEYKQVTVLFADVVQSMDIAATVGAERLREIMAELVERSAAVVKRYGGMVDKFTGDGIMAVFGAPVALEDHAARACLTALRIQEEAKRIAADVQGCDGVELQLRIGLNSGQAIAGEIGSGPLGYTTIGEQVGMAQRMESVAPPAEVMLSASTGRLIDDVAALGEPELVQIKGVDDPVVARRLLGMKEQHRLVDRAESDLVGRRWEMSAVAGLLERAAAGQGAVAGVVGPPGIGKSRLAREVSAIADSRDIDVFTAFCESHTSEIPFHTVSRLLRAATGVDGLDGQTARDQVRDGIPEANTEDVLLFNDLLGIAAPDTPLPAIDPDARRRRLTALLNAALLARDKPALYVIEDAHWIDEASESMLAEFLAVIPQTSSLVLVTYRPEYEGALAQVYGAQTVALAPLSDSETSTLIVELLGSHPSVRGLGQTIAGRAAGNPFFAEEIVRELAERGALAGKPGAYTSTSEAATELSVPATLQATIAARIDRLPPDAKRTLSAAAVVGSRFNFDLLTQLGIEPAVTDLVAAQLIDQVRFTRQPAFVFHHPLTRAVAYEAQLKSDRAELHRRVAAAIERQSEFVDENATLIGEHLESAGELHAAHGWHMRAARWAATRDVSAAWAGWDRARRVADALPADDPDRLSMRIAARAWLCGNAFRVHTDISDGLFEELHDLSTAAGDKVSLANGMAGLMVEHMMHGRVPEASHLADETMSLVESIGKPNVAVGLSLAAISTKLQAGEMSEVLRWSQTVIELSRDDSTEGHILLGSPLAAALATRGAARSALGRAGWRDDFRRALTLARGADPMSYAIVITYTHGFAIADGVLLADDAALRHVEEAIDVIERSSEDFTLGHARWVLGVALVHRESPADHERGLAVLEEVRDMCLHGRFNMSLLPDLEVRVAREQARRGDPESAVPRLREAIDNLFQSGQRGYCVLATFVLVETLLDRRTVADVAEAEAAIDRLVAAPADDGLVSREVWLLRMRALLARARLDERGYRDYRDRYRMMAKSLGFEGHTKWAQAMP